MLEQIFSYKEEQGNELVLEVPVSPIGIDHAIRTKAVKELTKMINRTPQIKNMEVSYAPGLIQVRVNYN